MPPPPEPVAAPARTGVFGSGFDLESLVGVKLFSAVAGIALVIAAVFFLRYSIEHGWLQPPVRVLIGLAVAIGLLVACEMKAARRYPATANALDAAAIAILFSTFFAAHALWDLIPAPAAFGLLALVTALAVMLSIRRDSIFIAILGLLGGFATPVLLSTGENRPVPLFGYLLLLNVGLAWVAYRRRWPALSVLTFVFTTIYQWGWVIRFMDATSVPLALGIFLLFPAVTIAALLVFHERPTGPGERHGAFERTALAAAMAPFAFGVYLAAVPAYGARPALLFGFLLLLDAGMFAIALARGHWILHALGAAVTVLVTAVFMALSYTAAAWVVTLAFTAALVLLYLLAPVAAVRATRPVQEVGRLAEYGAPLLLFVFPALVRIEPAFVVPWPLFAPLLALLVMCAWRASASGRGAVYFIAAFLAVAAQGIWSVQYLTMERLGTAIALYLSFGLVTIAVPAFARSVGRPLMPAAGSGAVVLGSLGLLLYLSVGPVAPAAIWALALLLAILNAGLFIESAGTHLPKLSLAGSLLTWLILTRWWLTAAGSVGVFPSLAVLVLLTLVTLGGHAWVFSRVTAAGEGGATPPSNPELFIGLGGHLFLLLLVTNRAWAIPPWPVFGALGVITMAASVASLRTRAWLLHTAAVAFAALTVSAWTATSAHAPWPTIGLPAAAIVSAYALAWTRLFRRYGDQKHASAAAAAALVGGELTAVVAAAATGAPPFAATLVAHGVNVSVLLALSWSAGLSRVPILAAGIAWAVVLVWTGGWTGRLVLSSVLYAILVAYPFVLGRAAMAAREPFVVAIIGSAMFFFSARTALDDGGYGWLVGAVPVLIAVVLAILLRQLLRLEPSDGRDVGRLALVAGSALAFITVAIPLQLDHQWITIGWALEGAALAWLFTRVPHRGLLYSSVALMGVVFVRLAVNPEIFRYEPRGELRILNWYLYAYAIAAIAMFFGAWQLSRTDERLLGGRIRPSRLLPGAGVVLLFLLLNIEIADFYATGSEITFRFGAGLSQDLTYTIGWLVFGVLLLAAGIYLRTRAARVTAVALIAVTTFKCFLYDLGSLDGLYRVAAFVGLALALALVSLALQKYVLAKPTESAS